MTLCTVILQWKGMFSLLWASACYMYRSAIVPTYPYIFDVQKHNNAILQLSFDYIARLHASFANGRRWPSAAQPLRRSLTSSRNWWRLVYWFGQCIALDIIQEYPIVEYFICKMLRCNSTFENCTGRFWITVGHSNYVLVIWCCSGVWSRYVNCDKI